MSSTRPGWGCCLLMASRSMAWILATAAVRSFRVWMFRMWVRMSTDLSMPRADLYGAGEWLHREVLG